MSSPNEDIANRPCTIGERGARKWIHAAKAKGRFQHLRFLTSSLLVVLFFASPWIVINGESFIKLSFLESSFILFGKHILIYEFYHFVLLAILLVITLFIASALFGRVWCGYACPQTIFIEQIFGRIETLCEGPAAKRILQESKPLTANIILRKVIKQILYVAVSFSFAYTLVAIFTGPEIIFSNKAAIGSVIFLTAVAWFDGAYWREQFCHIVCPYARFQGVMQDHATRTIGYDSDRGEPRGRQEKGACIDCGLCVRVCPSGIDIRQGASQIECTACARCVDACDGVMTSLHRPKGLIRYDALAVFSEKTPRPKMLRPRLFVYAGIWISIFGFGLWKFVARSSLHANILSVSGALPYFLENGRIKNLSNLKIGNQGKKVDSYDIRLDPESSLAVESSVTSGPIALGKESLMPVLISGTEKDVGKVVRIHIISQQTKDEVIVERMFVGPKEGS